MSNAVNSVITPHACSRAPCSSSSRASSGMSRTPSDNSRPPMSTSILRRLSNATKVVDVDRARQLGQLLRGGLPPDRGAAQEPGEPTLRRVPLCDRRHHLYRRRAQASHIATTPDPTLPTPGRRWGTAVLSTPRVTQAMSSTRPRAEIPVCVVIPAYNRATQVGRSLASVQAQHSLRPKEVIVVDDHSSDDTAAVAASLGARVIRHSENRGPAAARNSALAATDCEWLAFLDSDDEWLPHHLAHLWSIRGEHALVGAAAFYRSADGKGDRFFGPVSRRPMRFESPDRLISTLNFFTTSGSMVRRDAALAVGGFHEWWGAEDFDLWVRVLERYTGICSRRVTVNYHLHDAQVSLQAERMLREHRQVVRSHVERTGQSAAMLERWEAGVAWDRLRAEQAAGRRRAALRYVPRLVSGPQRPIGLASQLWLRFRVRRRTDRLQAHGGPSIAVLVRAESQRHAVLRALEDPAARDLSARGTSAALLELLRRPAGLVVAATPLQIVLLRLLGNRAVTAAASSRGRPSRRARLTRSLSHRAESVQRAVVTCGGRAAVPPGHHTADGGKDLAGARPAAR